jgi:hypothetical protein
MNDNILCHAGINGFEVVNTGFVLMTKCGEWVGSKFEENSFIEVDFLKFFVNGRALQNRIEEYINWVDQTSEIGDRAVIKVIKVNQWDEPMERIIKDASKENKERETRRIIYEMMKREFEDR